MRAPGLRSAWAIGGAGALLLAPLAGTALGRLAAARAALATARAEAAAVPRTTPPLVGPGLAIAAPDAVAARDRLIARLVALARADGLLVEQTAPAGAAPALAAVRLSVSGNEKAVLAFADAVERQPPLVRLRNWQLVPVPGGVRLTGEAVAAWQ